jgi:hypothetical protein
MERYAKNSLLIATLLLDMIILSTLYIVQPAQATNTVAAKGEIELTNNDGTPFTTYNFALFNPGTPETQTKTFYIRNTGKHTVQIEWRITAGTIQWNRDARTYCHYEKGIAKYTLAILQKTHGYLKPEKQHILLNPNERTKLTLQLSYTGEPNTPETFTLTIAFIAQTHSR